MGSCCSSLRSTKRKRIAASRRALPSTHLQRDRAPATATESSESFTNMISEEAPAASGPNSLSGPLQGMNPLHQHDPLPRNSLTPRRSVFSPASRNASTPFWSDTSNYTFNSSVAVGSGNSLESGSTWHSVRLDTASQKVHDVTVTGSGGVQQ